MYIKSNFSKYIPLLFICLNLFAQKPLEISAQNENELKIENLREIIKSKPQRVYLAGQHITTEILERIIPDLEQCEYLNLRENQLTELPESIGDLTNLKTLYLKDNKLTSLPKNFGNLTNLKELDLSNNKLSSLPDSFGKLTKLTNLYLSNNELSSLPDIFDKLTKLQYLGLENNKFSFLPDSIGKLTNLQYLNLSNNKFSFLPDSISSLTNLQDLDLYENTDKNGEIITVKIPKTLDRERLRIYGNYEFIVPENQKPTANIVIILDRGSQNLFVMQVSIHYAIQESIPILVSGQILKNYLERKRGILDIYEIYKLNKSDLYLFLPRGISYKKAFNLNNTTETTVKHLENTLKKNSWPNNDGNYAEDNWLDGIKSIFQKDTNYWWNIVLDGHGTAKTVICGLKTKDFKKLITFLNSSEDINVFFFFYDTCFGGGSTLIEPHKIIKNNIVDIPPLKFILVSGATREAVADVLKTDYSNLFKRLQDLLNFEERRKDIGSDPINDLLKIIKKDIRYSLLTTNIPLIKFPNTQFFMPVRKDTRVKVINNVLLKKHQFAFKKNKQRKLSLTKKITPIKINKLIKTIFVYPNIINVPIEIKTETIPKIVSLDPGTTIHFFSEIKTENSRDKLIQDPFFEKEEKEDGEKGKIFVIKKLANKDNEYTDVVVDSENNVAFYKKENKFYEITKTKPETEINEEQFKNKITEILQENINLYLKNFPNEEITYIPVAPWKTEPAKLIKYINKKLKIKILNTEKLNKFKKKEKLKKIIGSNPQNVHLNSEGITKETLEKIIPDLEQCEFLDLSFNKLSSLPESISSLTNLQNLNLSNNKFSSLPESIGSLTNLKKLYLEQNKLSSLPDSIGKLTNLQYLNLSNNNLSSLPDSIGKLTNLQYLYLEQNKLSSLPESFDKLTNLQTLNLKQNKLSSLPDSIGKLTNLQYLYLKNNKLSSLPESFDKLTNLQKLNLENNELSSLPDSIGDLKNLRFLDLSHNKFSYLPDSIGELTNLQYLFLDKNMLTSLPDSIGSLTNLQDLCLRYNKLSSLPDSIGKLTNLKELDLQNNEFSSLPDSIGSLTNLQKLDLQNNELSSLPDSIGKLTKLQRLNLARNTDKNGKTIIVKIPKTLDHPGLKISGNYEFVDPEKLKAAMEID